MDKPFSTTLDLRDLPAPEPLVRALVAVDALMDGAVLCVLRSRRLAYSIAAHDGGGCAVTVWNEHGPAVD